jgi:hypothetical protein
MSTTDYLINIALVLLVLTQIRNRRMDLRSLILPVVAVAGAAFYYLKGIPTAGNDVVLELGLGALGVLLGVACARTTSVWRDADGVAYSRAGLAAAVLWVLGVGSRLAFEVYATHGGAGAIARFSASHSITSGEAWTAALVLMALADVISRMIVLRVRAARATTPAAVAAEGRPLAVTDLVA